MAAHDMRGPTHAGQLDSGDAFILGPGGLVEIIGEKEIRLVRGEME